MSGLIDFSVVGSGIGGTVSASLLQNYNTHLFEKEPYLGGCSGSFRRESRVYNIGATTFSIYEKNSLIYNYFDKIGLNSKLEEKLEKIDPAITVIMKKKDKFKKIRRFQKVEDFISEFNQAFEIKSSSKSSEFWHLIKQISDLFHSNAEELFFSRKYKFKTALSFAKMGIKFPFVSFQNGEQVIKKYFSNPEILNFIDNQVLIVAQTKTKNTNFLITALALSYTFYDNFYSVGGMGEIFKTIKNKIKNIHRNTEVKNIIYDKNSFILETEKKSFRSKNVILNSSIFSDKIKFENMPLLENYQKNSSKLDSDQSAFVTYVTVKIPQKDVEKLDHHYQIIIEKNLFFTVSNSIFVSISDSKDEVMSKNNLFSVTISTHTKNSFWQENYYEKKERLQNQIAEIFVSSMKNSENVDLEIETIFSATPNTFDNFINRASLGGIPATTKNLFKFLSPETPVKNLYFVGDNIFMGQGWIGAVKGALNLNYVLSIEK